MTTVAYVYKWTHIPSEKWYVGVRAAKGCHPDDGYICSSKVVKPLIIENRAEWRREILSTGSVDDMLKLEVEILKSLDARHDPMSFNKHNGDGISAWAGDKNPMKNPEVAKRHGLQRRGIKRPEVSARQLGKRRPEISGDKHPNKKPENAKKISVGLSGKSKSPEHVQKLREVPHLSGNDHWMRNPNHKRTCENCGIECSKSNYTRWHGGNCKKKTTEETQ